MAALFFDGLGNVKFNALKTDISNQALQVKYSVPRTYYKVLKLVGGWENKSAITHNNNNNSGVAMVHPGGPGRGDQGVRGRGRGQVGRYGRGGSLGFGKGGVGRGAKNQQQQKANSTSSGQKGTNRRLLPLTGQPLCQ